MTAFLAEYGGTILVVAILAAAVFGAVWHVRRTHKQGGCAGCPGQKNCNCGCAEEKKSRKNK